MLSHKLSKILAEKNVPHEGGMWWVKVGTPLPYQPTEFSDEYTLVSDAWFELEWSEWKDKAPAYPEIALFKYAKVIWKGELFCKNCEKSCGKDWSNQLDCGCDNREPIEPFTYHTHTLADLFSSGASLETIENYVLESLEDK